MKGKMVVSRSGPATHGEASAREGGARPSKKWKRAPPGWAKLNVNGSFLQADGTEGAGMILRNSSGVIIFASCGYLRACTSALETEFAAINEGIELTLEWSFLPFIVETRCATVVDIIKNSSLD